MKKILLFLVISIGLVSVYFSYELADEKAAAAASTAAYQDSLLEEELAAFEAQLEAELAAQEMMAEIEAEMARQAALDAFQAKLAADKAAAAASTAAYQAKLARDERLKNKRAELKLGKQQLTLQRQLFHPLVFAGSQQEPFLSQFQPSFQQHLLQL